MDEHGYADPVERKKLETGESLPSVMTVDETAKFLRVNRKTVYEAIRAGQIPATWIGRRVVIYRNALLDFLRSKCALPSEKGHT